MPLASSLIALALAASAAPAPPNALHALVERYRAGRDACAGDRFTAMWRMDMDPLLARWKSEPSFFPLAVIGERLVARATAETGLACAAGGERPGTGCEAFRGTAECVHAVALVYERSRALRELPIRSADGTPAANMIARDLSVAAAAYRELAGGVIDLADPRPDKESVLDRVADTGVGYFAPFQDQKIAGKLVVEAYQDKGRLLEPKTPCEKETITQAEMMYAALEATGGNATQAMGGLSGVLHDGFYAPEVDGRKAADCVNGLSRSDYKDYYRFGGLYVGLQESAAVGSVGAAAAKSQVWAYGAVASVVGLDPAYMTTTARSKAPEFDAGLAAGRKFRAALLAP